MSMPVYHSPRQGWRSRTSPKLSDLLQLYSSELLWMFIFPDRCTMQNNFIKLVSTLLSLKIGESKQRGDQTMKRPKAGLHFMTRKYNSVDF